MNEKNIEAHARKIAQTNEKSTSFLPVSMQIPMIHSRLKLFLKVY